MFNNLWSYELGSIYSAAGLKQVFICKQTNESFSVNPEKDLVLSICSTDLQKLWSSFGCDILGLNPTHYEADTWIVLHVKEANEEGLE